MNILSDSPEKTRDIGRKIGRLLKKGDVVAVVGELGAGKTCLAQGIMRGLGVTGYSVTSPTFVLINEYEGRLWVYHFDLYRINNIKEALDIGCEEYFYGDGVSIVEWADNIKEMLPKKCVKIRLKITGDKKRNIFISGIKIKSEK